jgi:hypothetical protein
LATLSVCHTVAVRSPFVYAGTAVSYFYQSKRLVWSGWKFLHFTGLPQGVARSHRETCALACEGRSGVCSVSALKRVTLQAMSSWLAVGFSRDLGDLTGCGIFP